MPVFNPLAYLAAVARGASDFVLRRRELQVAADAGVRPLGTVRPAPAKAQARPARNKPCPCGATKELPLGPCGGPVTVRVKYKHCHGAPDNRRALLAAGRARPNDQGNYAGKRLRAPATAALSPTVRFALLWSAYQRGGRPRTASLA